MATPLLLQHFMFSLVWSRELKLWNNIIWREINKVKIEGSENMSINWNEYFVSLWIVYLESESVDEIIKFVVILYMTAALYVNEP